MSVLPWALQLFQEFCEPHRVRVLFGNLGTLLDSGTGTLDLAMKAASCLPRSKQTFFFFFSLALSHSQRNFSSLSWTLGSLAALKLKPDGVLGGEILGG